MKKLFITLALLVSYYFGAVAQEATKADTNIAEITFESTTIDYGVIEHNADGVREFKFTNTGNAPLMISNCQGSCGCTVPTCPNDTIMVGAKGAIKVKYATNRVGPFTKSVTVLSNSKTPSVVLQIKGEVLPDKIAEEQINTDTIQK